MLVSLCLFLVDLEPHVSENHSSRLETMKLTNQANMTYKTQQWRVRKKVTFAEAGHCGDLGKRTKKRDSPAFEADFRLYVSAPYGDRTVEKMHSM